METDTTPNQRKERRFVTCDQERLQTETFIEFEEPVGGTVIDISQHGLRLLSCGKFQVGQPFVTELKTDQLHGVFPGIIRHVQPWMEGKSVLGCQLLEPIPNDVLETLARDNVINRRDDQRYVWNQDAKMSWELSSGEVDVQIEDCSQSGLKVVSQVPVPDDVCVRIRISAPDQESVSVAARTAWQYECDESYSLGFAFTKRETPKLIRDVLGKAKPKLESADSDQPQSSLQPGFLVAATVLICGAAIIQAKIWGQF